MPIYEYVCPKCGHEEEVLVRSREERERLCVACGLPMDRKVSLPGTVIFNGSGYYTTDYKRKEGGASGKSGSGSAAPSAAPSADAPGAAQPGTAKEPAPAAAKDSAKAPAAAPAAPAKKE